MQNPIDALGVHPSGAVMRRPDQRDYVFGSPEVGMATAPFDWHKGYDAEADVAQATGSGFQLETKDQGSSGSCGGQAISYYAEMLVAKYLKEVSVKSAKAPYGQVYVPGGGSADRDLANIYIKQGIYKEHLVSSYPSWGGAPDEAFMERPQDITPASRIDAAKEAALIAYSFPNLDIDSVALALSVSTGVMIGVHGTNNGTWLSSEPKPPTPTEEKWAHYLYAGKAFLENGVKKIWAKQSWGAEAAPNNGNWQKLDASYFATPGAIWSAMAVVISPKPVTTPGHVFTSTLKLGDTSPDVNALQQVLAYDGCFNLAPTGYYGSITAQAVLRFQIKYNLASIATLEELGGDVVGPATLAKLNSISH